MKIGELFVQLGVTGADKSVSALASVQDGLKNIASAALGVTAAVTTAVYAIKKLGDESSNTGMDLKNFETSTGMSSEMLQRWQVLSMHAGKSAEEMESSFKQLQSTMFRMVAGGQAPEGMARFVQGLEAAGSTLDRSRFRDISYMMSKLREYALLYKNRPDATMDVLKSFVSPGTATALMASKGFDLNTVSSKFIYNKNQQDSLANLKVQWDMLIAGFEHSIGRMNAQFGPGIFKEISHVSSAFLAFAESLAALETKIHVLDKLSVIFEGWAKLFGYSKDLSTGKEKLLDQNQGKAFLRDAWETIKGNGEKTNLTPKLDFFSPEVQRMMLQGKGSTHMEVQNNFTIQGNGDAQDIAQAISEKLATHHNNALRQIQGASTGSGS